MGEVVQDTQSFPYFLEWAPVLMRSLVWDVRDRNVVWWGSPYNYPMFLTGAGGTPQLASHGRDGTAAAGSGAAQEADCRNFRTFSLGTPGNKELGTRGSVA